MGLVRLLIMNEPVPVQGFLVQTGAGADARSGNQAARPSAGAPHAAQTRWRALVAWITAAAIAPALLTISPVIKGASLGATIEQGDFWLIACSVALGALIIELHVGGKDAPRLLLQLAHIALAFTSLLYFSLHQVVTNSGAIVTKMNESLQLYSLIGVLLATGFASVSVLRENGL